MSQKLSKAEAGKIGSIRSVEVAKAKKQARIAAYDLNPSVCQQCQQPLEYSIRKNSFCGHSCRATFYNTGKTKPRIKWSCEACGKEHETTLKARQKYCSNSCQQAANKQKTWERLLNGDLSDRGMIRNTLIREVGRHCFECNLEEWRGHLIPLEVDHIDGNAGNNSFENLRLLCPNCHGITTTWKGRNKGSGRAARGLPLY